ncbi:QueT transporter family protein [Ignisphaera sp. 4213-co]|uniref:QueT transporter family protein n=1 Tax=Ignisphaera cupida TaxID=3050454 RepID=A0ABD4ZAU1_9CREN|nr:QueT transporter family protein [Ignisphaera sp. 4213-co]MDK6029213.1 QueT transporter family protein [Ignisphaera sp. 4213-co]
MQTTHWLTKSVEISRKVLSVLVLAAIYAALVIGLQPISFGPIQFRVADILSPITYVTGLEGVAGLTLGTLIGNIVSPYGVLDMVIGTLCTFTYSIVNWLLGKLVGYRKKLLPIIAVLDATIVGFDIGFILLGLIFRAGNPLQLFILVFTGNVVATMIGALLLVPRVRKYFSQNL